MIINKLLPFILFSLIISISVHAQESGKRQYKFFKKQKTYIKNPFELRDPFRRPIKTQGKKRKKRFGGFVDGNVFSNLPSIDGVPLEQIRIVGVLLGKQRRAMAKVSGSDEIYMLKEGMLLGVDRAEIKAILPGGLVLAEKIRNVYDQDEYLETIIPIQPE